MKDLTPSQKRQRDLFCAAALTGILSRGGKHDPNDDAMEAYESAEALMAYIDGVDECNLSATED